MPTHSHVVPERISRSHKNRSGDGKDPGKTQCPYAEFTVSCRLPRRVTFPEIFSDVNAARQAIRRQAGRCIALIPSRYTDLKRLTFITGMSKRYFSLKVLC